MSLTLFLGRTCRSESYLTVFLILSTIFAIGIATVLSVMHLWTNVALTVARVRGGRVAQVPLLTDGKDWHVFISHRWATGQDQCRILKSRLQELIPGIQPFLDVDNLKDITEIPGAVRASCSCLIFMSRGYFLSRGCMAELYAALEGRIQLVIVLETDPKKGGYTLEEAKAECPESIRPILFRPSRRIIDWHRLGAFQQQSLLIILEDAFPSLANKQLHMVSGPRALASHEPTTAVGCVVQPCPLVPTRA